MSFWSVPPSRARGNAGLFGLGHEHREDDGGRRVDRHRRGDRTDVDVAVEIGHVGDRVDGHAAAPDLAERHRVVGVEAEQRWHVERRRQAVAPRLDDLLEAPVGVVGSAESGEHAHGPELRAVHRRVRPTGVRVLPGEFAVVGSVDRIERDARHGLEVGVTQWRRFERLLPQLAVGRLIRCHGSTEYFDVRVPATWWSSSPSHRSRNPLLPSGQDPIDLDHRNWVDAGWGRCAEAGEPRSAVQAATAMA